MKKLIYILLALFPLLAFADGRDDFGTAQWIGATTDADDSLADRSIILSKTIDCKSKDIDSAVVYICGLGCYELYIDGTKVGDDILSPAWSDYRKTVFYNVIDVTPFLKNTQKQASRRSGKHTIEVLLGNSFYHERGLRYHKLKSNYGPITLLFNLKVTDRKGHVKAIASDNSWQWRKSPITYNSIYGGEDYDARLETKVQPSDLHAVVQAAPKGVLRRQLSYPVKIMQRIGAKASNPQPKSTGTVISESPIVFDMGQNLAGFPEITIRGKRGQRIKLTVGESLRKDGLVSQKQTGSPHYYIYTLKGDSTERWHPRFSYYSFRYIQVELIGATASQPSAIVLPELVDIKSDFIYNSAASSMNAATFECSNPLFNETFNLIDKAVKSNWMSVWTDCPAREKLGWLEQDWLNGPGLITNYDSRKMIEQEMIVISDAQHDDGSMPEIAPEYIKFEGSWAPPFQESPEWGGALIALPYLYKQFYGDDKLIRLYKPHMRRYADYLATRDSSYILKMGLGDWYDYGDWRAGFSRNTPLALVSTAHYYLWTKLAGYADRADSIKQAFLKNFPVGATASQAALSIMLELGLYNDGQEQELVDSLVADIHRHGDRLTTGDIGTPYLFRTLFRHNLGDLLYKMLNHYDVPGYGAQLKKGMTTLSEQWNPDYGASRNHFMLGHINNHLIPDVVGIRIDGGKVTISPTPIGDLTWVKGSTVGSGERIAVGWRIDNGEFILNVEAPNENKITIDYEKINNMCNRRNLRLQYKFTSTK